MSDWDFLESHDNADYHGFKDAPQDGKYYIAPFKVCGVKTFIKKSYIGNPPEEHNIEMYKYAANFFNRRKSNVNKAIQQTLNEGVKFNIKSCILETNEDGARVSFYSTLSGDENHKYKVVMLTSDGECYSSYNSKATWVYESFDDFSFLEESDEIFPIPGDYVTEAYVFYDEDGELGTAFFTEDCETVYLEFGVIDKIKNKVGEHRKKKFLKQHDYDPKTGTIKNGNKRQRIRFNGDNQEDNDDDKAANASIGAKSTQDRIKAIGTHTQLDSKSQTTSLSDTVVQARNNKGKEFAINHEIGGHNDRQSANPLHMMDNDALTPSELKRYMKIAKQSGGDARHTDLGNGMNPENFKKALIKVNRAKRDPNSKTSIRMKNREIIAKKYANPSLGGHQTIDEIEADIAGMTRSKASPRQAARMLKKVAKGTKKEKQHQINDYVNSLKGTYSLINPKTTKSNGYKNAKNSYKNEINDIKVRKKAMKDKDIDRSVYENGQLSDDEFLGMLGVTEI